MLNLSTKTPNKINIIYMNLIILSLLIAFTFSQNCAADQFFNGQRCAPCKSNCKCSSQNGCTSCVSGYAFDSTFQNCLQCPTSVDSVNVGCAECCSQIQTTEFVCSSCPSTSYTFFRGGQCIRILGCQSLDKTGRCKQCADGYYLIDGTCVACDASCKTCQDNTLCVTCKDGYYNETDVDFSLCQACPAGCATCTSSSTCQTCETGYRLSSTSCIQCPSQCTECSAGGCSACETGAALVSSSCPSCTNTGNGGSVGCLKCYSQSNSIRCSKCDDGYYLVTGSCVACTSRYANAALCTYQNLIQCQDDSVATLSSRYYKIDGRCVANTNNCKSMVDNTGKCSQCYFQSGSYYRLTSGKVCVQCSVSGCKTYNSTDCSCLSCEDGYRFTNGQCYSCNNLHCHVCQSSESTCEECAPYYGLSSSACISCTQSMCLNCDGDNTYCVTCENGYYVSDGTCYNCQTSCERCLSNMVCTKCASTHYLLANGRCKSLPSNCVEVDENGSCTKCEYGYKTMFGTCFECSADLINMNTCERFCPSFYNELATERWILFSLVSLIFVLLLLTQ